MYFVRANERVSECVCAETDKESEKVDEWTTAAASAVTVVVVFQCQCSWFYVWKTNYQQNFQSTAIESESEKESQ